MTNETESKFDLIVVGGGPGGYVAAIRASQLGLKTAVVEKRAALGGTCLNVGCIPSKALLASSEYYHFAAENFAKHGIIAEGLSVDLGIMMARKERVVSTLTKGLDFLFKKNKIARIAGFGTLVDEKTVEVSGDGGKKMSYFADHIILATGSVPVELPFLPFDGERVLSSDHAIALPKVPESLIVIGAGAIGLELGSVWNRLGAKVTVLEFLPRIAAGLDEEVGLTLQKSLQKQGLEFHLETKVLSAQTDANGVTLTAEKGGETLSFSAESVLVSVGRKPSVEGLGLEAAGVKLTEKGRVQVDERGRTSISSVYAIGDVVGGAMLAHKAEEEGVAVAERIAGKEGHVNYGTIPAIVYTSPEAAAVGETEEQLKEKGVEYRVGKFTFYANGRAMANDAQEGFVKILADAKTDRILGVHILSTAASELIAEAVVVMEFGGSAEDLARTVHGHPTMSEVMKEAALSVAGRPIHG